MSNDQSPKKNKYFSDNPWLELLFRRVVKGLLTFAVFYSVIFAAINDVASTEVLMVVGLVGLILGVLVALINPTLDIMGINL